MTEKLFWQKDEKKPVVRFRARSEPRVDNRSWFVTTIPAHRDNEGMKAAVLKTDMAGLSYKPAWLDQIVQVTATTNHENSPKISVFEGYFRINYLSPCGGLLARYDQPS